MKYLLKFNEELDSTTYRRASYKLKKLGHEDRAKDLEDWADKVENLENIEKWQQNKKDFSKFGKFKLKITNTETKESFIGDFYLNLVIDRLSFGDSLDEIKEERKGQFWMPIGLIPVDDETLNNCLEKFEDNDMSNGFFWGLSLSLFFEIEGDVMKFTNHYLDNYDVYISGDVKIADRASAGRFRNLLIKMFSDESFNYPSGYNDITNFYDMVVNIFGAEYGLSSDYGFEPEQVSKFMNTVRPNEIYKTI